MRATCCLTSEETKAARPVTGAARIVPVIRRLSLQQTVAHVGAKRKCERLAVVDRHPEVAAQRPSKDGGPVRAVALRGSLRSRLRVTGRSQQTVAHIGAKRKCGDESPRISRRS